MHKDKCFSSNASISSARWTEIFGKRVRNRESVQKPTKRENAGPYVLGDIQPFKSPVDGSYITSRSQLREHEKRHGVRQVGNDWSGREKPSCWEQRADIVRTGKWERPRSDD